MLSPLSLLGTSYRVALLVILIHGSTNTILRFLAPIVLGGAAYGQFWWLLAALWWVVAVVVIAVIGMARQRGRSIEAPAMAATSRSAPKPLS